MGYSYCPDALVTPAKRRDFRLIGAVVAATSFTGAYGAYVLRELDGPVREGSVALHVIGLALAVAGSLGAWGALRGSATGLSLQVQAAQGSLFLLVSALALATLDEWWGAGVRAGDPSVLLAALGALQAAALLLALRAHAGRRVHRGP